MPVSLLQKKFKTLDLQGKAANWLRKYPCCFVIDGDHFRLSKRMAALADEEEAVRAAQEPAAARRLAKLLMMSASRRLNAQKLNGLKRSLGLPDDYLVRILPASPELFRLLNRGPKKASLEIELASWDPTLAISAAQASSGFRFSLPDSFLELRDRFDNFQESTPYVSPYSGHRSAMPALEEKRAVGVVHELLSLTLWKKASILKLGHFRREFGLPERLEEMLLRHPGIFYVSNKYDIKTVILREAYRGSVLLDKDPLVVAKERLGELMQEGRHEYNQRRRRLNFEKKRQEGAVLGGPDRDQKQHRRRRSRDHNTDGGEDEDDDQNMSGLFDPEERKRFYRVLFEEDAP